MQLLFVKGCNYSRKTLASRFQGIAPSFLTRSMAAVAIVADCPPTIFPITPR